MPEESPVIGIQSYVLAPELVNVVEVPPQIATLLLVVTETVFVITGTDIVVPLPMQPLAASVAVTVYDPAASEVALVNTGLAPVAV
jgi:hypothetical protein